MMNLLTYFALKSTRKALILAGAVTPTFALADIITINNPGFEDPVLADGVTSGTSTPGWNRLGSTTFLNPSNVHFPGGNATEGFNVATMGAGGSGSSLFQNLPNTTLQYGTYTFQFDVGDRLDEVLHNLGFNLLINATTIVPLTSSNTPAVPDGEFRTWTFTYDVLVPSTFENFIGDPTRIRFLAFGSQGFSTIDNVQGTFTAIPEPSSAALIAIACGVVCFRRRL